MWCIFRTTTGKKHQRIIRQKVAIAAEEAPIISPANRMATRRLMCVSSEMQTAAERKC